MHSKYLGAAALFGRKICNTQTRNRPEALSCHHAELLELATPQGREMWQEVSLAYTETQGLPELRRLVSERLYDEARPSDEPRSET